MAAVEHFLNVGVRKNRGVVEPQHRHNTFIKQTMHILHLTQLYNILLLYYYWLLVLGSVDHYQANIYKKNLKMLVHILQEHQLPTNRKILEIHFIVLTS